MIAGGFLFVSPEPAQAQSAMLSEQQQLASLVAQVQTLQRLFNALKQKLVKPARAVAACADGIDNDNDGLIDYPSDTGCYSADDPDEAYTASTATSSCSQSLLTLLGSGCHYMYNDSSGNYIYCNGEMTQSAKSGDTAVTQGCSSHSSSTSTSSGTPSTPTSVSAAYYSSSNSVEISWDDNSAEDQFKVYRQTGYDGAWTFWAFAPSSSGGRVKYWDSALTAGATYNYKVQACVGSSCSADSSVATMVVPSSAQTSSTSTGATSTQTTTTTTTTTTGTTGTTATTGSSANLTATASGADVTLTWTDFYTGENNYEIERKTGTGAWVKIGTTAYLAGGNGTYKDVGVASGTYDYQVKPCMHTTGCYGTSNSARVTVGGTSTSTTAPKTATPPPVISNVIAGSITANSATITWVTDIQANSKVEYGVGTASNFVSDGTFTTNHSISLSGLIASTTYTYNVISDNQDYYRTTFSNQKFSTPASSASAYSLVAPTGLSARTDTNGYDVILNWTDNSYEDEYKVERRRTGESWATIALIPPQAGSGAYTDRSIPSGLYGAYEYQVKACGGGACSPESNIATVNVSGTTTSASCDSALTTLLGTGCHYMYSDSAGNAIYCDGPMAKSAKKGDTATTPGCALTGTTTSQCSDGRDNDGDGQIDYPADTGCYSREDNDETPGTSTSRCVYYTQQSCDADIICKWVNNFGCGSKGQCNDGVDNDNDGLIDYPKDTGCVDNFASYEGPGAGQMQCSDGKDNDGDGSIDYPKDASCYGPDDNDEYYPVGGQSGPAVNVLSPGSGPIGTKVTLTGSGFTATGNRVNFDTGVIPDLASPDGKTITFVVPDDRVPYCALYEPRCLLPAPYNPVKPGTYWVSVSNPNGTSGGMQLGVTEQVASVFAVDTSATTPKSGAAGIDVGTRIKVILTRELDPLSMSKEFFRFAKTGSPDARVQGSFTVFHEGFEFFPAGELEPGTSYTYTVLNTLRDRSGAVLSAPYTASFTTGGASRSSATLTGKVTDGEGVALAKAYVHVYSPFTQYVPLGASYSYQNNFWRNTETGADGVYKLSLPAGTYMVEVYAPYGRDDLTRVAPREVVVGAGETRVVDFTFGGVTKVITGSVLFSNGNPVADAEINAYAPDSRQWKTSVTDAAGRYTLKVGGGAWFVGIHPRESQKAGWSWNEKPRVVTFARDGVAQTQTVDFTVPLRDATIAVTVVDDAGSAFAGVGVVADTHSSASVAASFFGEKPEFRITGTDGKAKFTLRAGTYYLRAYLPTDRGYFNPGEQAVVVAGGEAKDIKLVFKKKQAVQTLAISGTTKLEEGVLVDAFIWAWSERGGFVSARADSAGTFSLTVIPNERWHVGAGKEYKGFPYKSPELVVDVKSAPVTIELVLTKQALVPLPPTVSVTQAAAQQVVAQATDGASITVPPGGAASSGTVRIEIKPTVEAPSQAGTDVVSTVYDVTIHDTAGNPVTSLASEAEIVIPYSEADLKKQGVTEDTIAPSYFDEKTGTWVHLDGCTIDKDRNVAVCRVDHLTRFAITARADTTPPDAPGAVSAKAAGGGKVAVSWKNPAKDFDYAKVYRSAKAGELGTVRAATLRASQFTDSEGLSDGVVYYYTIRAVDPAGNESANVAQVQVAAAGTSGAAAPKTPGVSGAAGAITKTLRRGTKSNEVKILQQVLIKEGLLASGSDTGFFGPATEAAVKKFQTKLGLEAVGIVGPATRKKLNAMSGQ